MARLATEHPAITPSTLVGCEGTTYDCPSIAAIDAHLDALRDKRDATDRRFHRLLRVYTQDIDMLLDYRNLRTPDTGDS